MKRTSAALLAFVCLQAPSPAWAIEPEAPQRLLGEEDRIAGAIRQEIAAASTRAAKADKELMAALAAFYEGRSAAPVWVARNGFTPRAESVMREIAKAADWGLDPADYPLPKLATADGKPLEPVALADAEIKLGLAALKYAWHASSGRTVPTAISKYLDRKPARPEAAKVLVTLATASDAGTALRDFNPKHPQFEALRQKLLEMRGKAEKAEEVVTLPPGPTLKPGMKHPHVALLRKRLKVPVATADGKPADEQVYDDALVDAVKAFQKTHGLRPDAIVGSGTRKAFGGKPESGSPERLIANMEAWRWMPRDLGSFYVTVNLPEYTVRVVKDGKVVHSERIIIGKAHTQTPIFSMGMQEIVFQPKWGVPNSIKMYEILPHLRHSPAVLARHGLKVSQGGRTIDPTKVDWNSADVRRFHFYQPPGRSNVLGVVKFRFPNKHDVYMHDTPTKGLFNSSTRMYSHGCMRVRDPVKLAQVLLAHDKGWSDAHVSGLASRGGSEENPVQLGKKIPVHITYFTAAADADGKMRYFRDIYGHEQRIRLALAGKWSQIRPVPEVKTPVRVARPADSGTPSGAQTFQSWMKQVFGGF
ncbi:MAG: L,D-transpeptidase family protein [Hyphomicrobiaceae bacterium]